MLYRKVRIIRVQFYSNIDIMIFPDGVIYSGALIRILILVLSSIICYQTTLKYLKYRIKVLIPIVVMFALSFLPMIIQIIYLIHDPSNIKTKFESIDSTMAIVAAFLILIYLDLYESSHLNAFRASTMTGLAIIALISNIPSMVQGLAEVNKNAATLFSFATPIYFVYILITTQNLISKTKKFAGPKQEKLIDHIRYFIFLGFGGQPLVYIIASIAFPNELMDYSNFQLYWYYVLPAIMIFCSNVFFYLGYVKPTNPSSIQPLRIDRFILISDSGLPIYNFKVDKDMGSLDEGLFSGAITAILSILREASNFLGDIDTIIVGNQYLNMGRSGNYIGVLFSYLHTNSLKISLSTLMDQLNGILFSIDDFNMITPKMFEEIDSTTRSILGND